ncbi:hypothetical protein [Stieleria varia]|uniref:Uncharacterized protein n=1 Tax=Stieleria varia TaxID=2528005 RepID=A0A5C5ZPV1_9BACT|nr:hypothetical protein [Stieleria varia]TWT89165.1 hypothetical protein Pla52n_68980 [Stieleria varia]
MNAKKSDVLLYLLNQLSEPDLEAVENALFEDDEMKDFFYEQWRLMSKPEVTNDDIESPGKTEPILELDESGRPKRPPLLDRYQHLSPIDRAWMIIATAEESDFEDEGDEMNLVEPVTPKTETHDHQLGIPFPPLAMGASSSNRGASEPNALDSLGRQIPEEPGLYWGLNGRTVSLMLVSSSPLFAGRDEISLNVKIQEHGNGDVINDDISLQIDRLATIPIWIADIDLPNNPLNYLKVHWLPLD